MFSQLIRTLPCEECEKGEIYYDHAATSAAWLKPEIFTLDEVDKIVDATISEVLIFTCIECGVQVRYTLKEVEKKFRKKLSGRLLTMLAMGNLPNLMALHPANRIMIYCGKCRGYDGKGSCPFTVYNNCEVKRLPYGF
jgi:hypothetical protein